jgi:thiamine pyrophosphokinase
MLVGGGRAPSGSWFRAAAAGRRLWAIDKGIDICCQQGIVPARLIGDADSADPQAWRWGEMQHIPVERFPTKKDLTDTQLALAAALKALPDCFIILTGAWGGRFDHAFSTIFSFANTVPHGCIADNKEACFFLHDQESLVLQTKKPPLAISLLPLSHSCQGVSINGVYWPLQQACLQQDFPNAVSNVLAADNTAQKFKVALRQGCLGLYMVWA